jgi:hypothetical protein
MSPTRKQASVPLRKGIANQVQHLAGEGVAISVFGARDWVWPRIIVICAVDRTANFGEPLYPIRALTP